MTVPTPTAAQRTTFESWLLDLTAIPTAAGREDRVIEWVLGWTKRRKTRVAVAVDAAGNLLLHQGPVTQRSGRAPAQRPLLITAHLDHPAFVVREVIDAKTIELEFRGGVHDPYFEGATIELFDRADRVRRAKLVSLDTAAKPYKRAIAAVFGRTTGLDRGDIGRWALPKARFAKAPRTTGASGLASRSHRTKPSRLLQTNACDDLAAVVAALAALDVIAGAPGFEHVGVLLTVAEEVGFVGAIATARAGGIPRDARLICLENSRSFPESPIGAGAILRVGDRLSVFSPELTNRLGQLFQSHLQANPAFRHQRKLMAGGACEATAFASYGYESTCLCLPLGNYHNMVDIDGVLAGRRPAKIGPEFVSVDDFHSLVEMLLVAATHLDSAQFPPMRERMEAIFAENKGVLGACAG